MYSRCVNGFGISLNGTKLKWISVVCSFLSSFLSLLDLVLLFTSNWSDVLSYKSKNFGVLETQ